MAVARRKEDIVGGPYVDEIGMPVGERTPFSSFLNVLGYLYRSIEPAILLIVIFVVWQILTSVLSINPAILPSPYEVVKEMVRDFSLLIPHVYTTFYETVLGFLLALVAGVAIAVVVAHSRFLSRSIYPVILISQSTPKLAIAPLLMIWFGTGLLPKVVLSFLISFFPIVINMASGLTLVEPDLLNLVRSYQASRWQVFVKVRFPNSLSYLFAGMKISIPISVIGAIVGEFISAHRGLGYVVLVANAQLKTAMTFAAIFYLGIMGICLFGAILLLEKYIIPWSTPEEIRAQTGGV